MNAESLQRRLLVAVLAAGAGACGKQPVQADAAPPVVAKPVLPPSVPKPNLLCGNETPTDFCIERFSKTPAAQGTGEPSPAPPSSAYDANGCLPPSMVTTGCCNPAITGPRLQDSKCCYAACEGSCCGRPFLVEGAPRVAAVTERADWLARDVVFDAVDLDSRMAAALHDAWLADATMEHASAAAFGRFMLQLLALGAPPTLVSAAARAAAEEVRHAELCFALAARFGGEAVGPSPLSLDGAFTARTLEAVIAEVVAEGCVGETIAALTAARQLEGATDPAVRRVLEQIRADEAAHAELAWSFVAWAIATGGDSARVAARAAFDRASSVGTSCSASHPSQASPAWHAFGRLTVFEQNEVARVALASVVAPLVLTLGTLPAS